jgi:hypothetical protein
MRVERGRVLVLVIVLLLVPGIGGECGVCLEAERTRNYERENDWS